MALRLLLFFDVIERLNTLLKAELAAVAGYQRALGTLRKKAMTDGDQILRLASEHQRAVTALHVSVLARGGVPVAANDSEGETLYGGSASPAVGGRLFFGALLEAEKRGLADYQASLPSLDEDARELVELELIPRQRRHVEALSAMLDHLAA